MEDDLIEKQYREDRWPASLALLACVGLYIFLPDSLIIQPRWLIPVLELLPLIPLSITHRRRHPGEPSWTRMLTLILVGIVNVANIVSVTLLVHHLLHHNTPVDGRHLVYSAILVWITNVIVFSLWFWELDRGGPAKRGTINERHPDFLFPQMDKPDLAQANWRPRYFDYLYVAFTNSAAFSPTDAMPLTRSAKFLMAMGSAVSMITIIVVASRAINILQ